MYEPRYMSYEKESSFNNVSNISDKKEFVLNNRDIFTEFQQSQHRLTVQELENKVAMLATENERLQQLLQEKQRDISLLQEEQVLCQQQLKLKQDDKLKVLEGKTNKMIFENEKVLLMNQSLSIQLEEMRYSYDELQERFAQETEILEKKWRNHFTTIYEHQINNLTGNIGNLLQELKQSSEIIKQYEDKVNSLQREVSQVKEYADNKDKKATQLLTNNESISNIIEKQEQQLRKSQERIVLLSSQMESLIQQNKSQSQIIDSLKRDLDERRLNYEELVIQIEELRSIEDQQKLQLHKNNTLFASYQQEIQQYKQEVTNSTNTYQKDVSILKSQLNTLIQENEDLSKVLTSIRNNFSNEQCKNHNLEQTLTQVQLEIHNKELQLNIQYNELETQKHKFEKLFQENSAFLKQQQNQFDIKLLQQQQSHKNLIDQLNQQKIKEVNNLNEKMNVLLQRIDEQTLVTNQLNFQNGIKTEELQQARPELLSLRNELKRLQQLTVDQNTEIDNLKLKLVRMEENFELQGKEQVQRMNKYLQEIDTNKNSIHALKEENSILQNNLQEALSNLSRLQQLLSETHSQLKQAEKRNEIQSQELLDQSTTKQQMIGIKEKHQRELDQLRKAFETNMKMKIDKEIAIEREKLDNYHQVILMEKRNVENQLQSMYTENQLLKNEIMQQQEYFKLQVQDLLVDQQKHLLNIDHAYKLEFKGLSEVQQAQLNAILIQYQHQINSMYAENQMLIEQNRQFTSKLRRSEKKQQSVMDQMDSRIHTLKKDNERLIDEKANERSRNTYLETQLMRTMTPVREARSSSTYIRRMPSVHDGRRVMNESQIVSQYVI